MSHLSYKAERAGRRVVKVDPRNASKTFVRGRGLPLEPVDREPLLYIPFPEGVYSKFPGRIKESSSRGGDAPSVRAG
ncbi:MAG: hypothetical protein RXO29_00490 [Desulfurococcales archaeon]